MAKSNKAYAARFDVEYVAEHDRTTTFFRMILGIPIVILITVLTASGGGAAMNEAGKQVSSSGGSIASGLVAATALMILFRQKYPRWWFDFALELNRFSTRVGSYLILLTDLYPSTTEKQAVKLDFDYPDVKKDLNRWMPLVKWFLAIPHYLVLLVLILAAILSTILAWFSILFTGRYPKSLFDFVVGVGRWVTRVEAYTIMLVTDEYPPFSLK